LLQGGDLQRVAEGVGDPAVLRVGGRIAERHRQVMPKRGIARRTVDQDISTHLRSGYSRLRPDTRGNCSEDARQMDFTAANAARARSRSSELCAADICVRIRAWPSGTTG